MNLVHELEAILNKFPTKNLGVLLGKRPEDYVAGKVSGIVYEVRLKSGDWRPYVVTGERQYFPGFDTFNCTGYSNNNTAEIQLKFETGVELNFSDRAMSVLAECTPTGNYLYKPADVGRKIGRILESDYPDDQGIGSWKQWNAPLSADVLAKAIRFDESYEWVGTDKASLLYHLKQAPIQMTIPGANPYHAVVLLYIDGPNNHYYYFDSYGEPFIKVMDTPPASALKIIVKPMSNAQFVHKANTQEYGFFLPATSPEAIKDKALNLGLQITNPDGSVNFAAAKEVTGLA